MNNDRIYKDFLVGKSMQFQQYGVNISIKAERKSYLKKCFTALEKSFPKGLEALTENRIDYSFTVKKNGSENLEFYLNDKMLFEVADQDVFFEMVNSKVRITIAEFAVGKVFLHAGVIGINGRAIVIPAKSFSGKTTLVAELVKRGAVYYSDEYAVLDVEGNVEPFPKWLSLRGIIDDWAQLDRPVEELGGIAGQKAIPAGIILISNYQKGKKHARRWRPEKLTQGQGIMEILPHTLPIRNNPKFVLEVLNKLTNRAIIIKIIRGEAVEFAESLLDYFDSEQKNFN